MVQERTATVQHRSLPDCKSQISRKQKQYKFSMTVCRVFVILSPDLTHCLIFLCRKLATCSASMILISQQNDNFI